jgi:hypothetical protein
MKKPKVYPIDMLPGMAYKMSSLRQRRSRWLIGLLMLAGSASTMTGQQPPQTGTVTPSSGQGSSGTFAFTASSGSGYQHIDQVQAILNWTFDGVDGCYVMYSQTANALYLMNDQATQWLGG